MFSRLAFLSLVITGALLGVAHGCSSSSSSGVLPNDSGITDSGNGFEVNVSDGPHCTIPPKPTGVPDGWELYTDYDPCCLIYVPSDTAHLPPPLQWTSCNATWTADSGLDGGECKQIDQPGAASPQYGAASVRSGVVSLLTSESVNGMPTYVTADVDGPVHQALMLTDTTSACTPVPEDMRDGKYVYSMFPPDNFNGGGFLAGDVDEFRPSFIHHFDDEVTHSVAVGALGVLDVDETDAFHLYEWAQSPVPVVAAENAGLQNTFPLFSANALFWSASSGSIDRVAVFTDSAGASNLLSSGADPTHGFDDFGADGQDMVWLEGSGHDAGPIGFDSADYMTAPFVTTSGAVTPRRLRSAETSGFGVSPTIVGCGYAARENGNSLRIIRLSDGVSWVLPNVVGWRWLHPLAITCTEVFASVVTSPTTNNVARVTLASLGTGIPPD